ncbi:DUF859 family phage minor structural protein [Streptococcus suis]|uniref:DUF859 family phage minor structural protein n=1 Tax=Streptococcus suis TaxID=1307 RepID=UPI000CF50714|nr:DUF859 family phage minor structural protein [Streptococcus suis]
MAVFRYSGNWRGFLEGTSSTVSQDISGNSSVIKIDVWIGMDAGWNIEFGNTYGNTVTVTCNGQSQTIAVGPLYLNGSKKHLGSVQFRVGHNADGTKSAGISLSSNMSNISYGTLNFGNASGSWFHGLTTIPRSSSVSVSSGVIGSALTININRQSSSFKHVVRYAWGNKSGTIATNVDTSTTWTIPLDFANDIPNSTSGTGTIYVDTYSGSTKTGTQSTAFTASVPDSIKPSLTGFTLIDGNTAARTLIPGEQQFVQIVSNIAVHFGQATGAYGSTISGYYAEIVGKNQSTSQNGGSLGIMNYHGQVTIRARVTDSRGRTSNMIERTVTVLEYFAPAFNFSVERSGATSSTFSILRNARIAPLTVGGSQRNTMTLTFRVAPADSNNYTPDNGPASGTFTTLASLTNSLANLSGTYSSDKSWDVIGILEDKFTRSEFKIKVSTEAVVFSYEKGNRFAVGKIVDTNLPKGSIESTGGYYLNGKPIQQHQLTSNAGRSPYNAPGTLDLNTKTINEFFACNEPVNGPVVGSDRSEFYVAVYSESDNYLSQNAIQKGTGRMFTRTRHGGTWTPWVEYATTNHPMLQEKPLKTLTMGFPYGLNATLIRKDSLVTITLNRRITNIDVFEYSQMVETIPLGYRPTVETHMLMAPNVGSFTKSPSVLHFASDGKIRLTNGTGGAHVYTGTITYITNDPYPA